MFGDHGTDVGNESARLGERRDGRPHQPQWSQDVGEKQVLDDLVGGVGEGTEGDDTGCVHQTVERVVGRKCGGNDRPTCLGVTEIGGHNSGVDSQGLNGISIAGCQRQSGTGLSELFRDVATDTTAGAGHHD